MHHPRSEGYFLQTLEWMDQLPSNLNSYGARLGNKRVPGGNKQQENDKDMWKNKASIWELQSITVQKFGLCPFLIHFNSYQSVIVSSIPMTPSIHSPPYPFIHPGWLVLLSEMTTSFIMFPIIIHYFLTHSYNFLCLFPFPHHPCLIYVDFSSPGHMLLL